MHYPVQCFQSLKNHRQLHTVIPLCWGRRKYWCYYSLVCCPVAQEKRPPWFLLWVVMFHFKIHGELMWEDSKIFPCDNSDAQHPFKHTEYTLIQGSRCQNVRNIGIFHASTTMRYGTQGNIFPFKMKYKLQYVLKTFDHKSCHEAFFREIGIREWDPRGRPRNWRALPSVRVEIKGVTTGNATNGQEPYV